MSLTRNIPQKFPTLPPLPKQADLTHGDVIRLLSERQPANETTFEHWKIHFSGCDYYNINKPAEVNYEAECASCWLGHAHTILSHCQHLMQKAIYPAGIWVVCRENELSYSQREEVWWNENVRNHPWKDEYRVCPRW